VTSPIAPSAGALLTQPVFDSQGRLVGRVGAVATRHGELRRIGIEDSGPGQPILHFVPCGRFTVEQDRIVLSGEGVSQ
jgi:hypothetical protein